MPSDSTNIEVQELVKLVEAEKKQWKRRSISKLPAYVTNIKDSAYTPQVVSLGPYHRENENLKPMEEHKDRAIKHFLIRSGFNYNDILLSLSVIQEKLMDAYDLLHPYFQQNPDAFLELMIRDGIFILEICDYRGKKSSGYGKKSSDYAYNDPIFSKSGYHIIPYIKRDMLMLENQIPMKVLHTLYGLQREATGEDANKVVFQFFFPHKNANTAPTNSLHILDMYRTVILGPLPTPIRKLIDKVLLGPHRTSKKKLIKGSGEDKMIRSAVELDGAGIKIKKSRTKSLGDISFKKGVLRLPMITVDDMTEPLLLNLMAYERFHYEAGNYVTDYVFFMNNIIDNAPDVRLLHSRNIIQNDIGTDEEVTKLFNSLPKDIYLDKNSPLLAIYESVNAYCETKISKCRAALYHPPWKIITLIGGTVISALTIIETVYAILEYCNKA